MEKKLVAESLDQLYEWKKKDDADEPKAAWIPGEHAKTEKSKAKKSPSSKDDDIKEKIEALEKQKKEAQKPGNMKKTPLQKKADIEGIQKKIDAWKAKLK